MGKKKKEEKREWWMKPKAQHRLRNEYDGLELRNSNVVCRIEPVNQFSNEKWNKIRNESINIDSYSNRCKLVTQLTSEGLDLLLVTYVEVNLMNKISGNRYKLLPEQKKVERKILIGSFRFAGSTEDQLKRWLGWWGFEDYTHYLNHKNMIPFDERMSCHFLDIIKSVSKIMYYPDDLYLFNNKSFYFEGRDDIPNYLSPTFVRLLSDSEKEMSVYIEEDYLYKSMRVVLEFVDYYAPFQKTSIVDKLFKYSYTMKKLNKDNFNDEVVRVVSRYQLGYFNQYYPERSIDDFREWLRIHFQGCDLPVIKIIKVPKAPKVKGGK